MRSSEQINLLAEALCLAQANMGSAVKDSSNPFFKSSYADLTSCINASRGILTKHNLSVSQTLEVIGDQNALVTILMHSSGQYLSSTYLLHPIKNDPQGMGSAITYARRYCYSAIIGQTTSDDDDGNQAVTAVQKEGIEKISEMQKAQLQTMLIELAKTSDAMCEYYKITRLTDMTVAQYQDALFKLTQQVKDKRALEKVSKAIDKKV